VRVFEKTVLRRISGLERDEVGEGVSGLHNEEHHTLYSSPGVVRMIKPTRVTWAGHVARMGEEGNACRLLSGKQGGKRRLGKAVVKFLFFLLKSWETQNFITIKTSWNTND
jgi:hypothetical protein